MGIQLGTFSQLLRAYIRLQYVRVPTIMHDVTPTSVARLVERRSTKLRLLFDLRPRTPAMLGKLALILYAVLNERQ